MGSSSVSVRLTPLSGAHSESPLCYLLQVDSFRFLLDCGWTDTFEVSQLQPLASVAPTIDGVLLSHPDTMHLGALPYAVGKLGLTATVYCTLPVLQMGQMYMYDHYLSRKAVSNFDTFDLDEVDNAFGNSVQLKYSEHRPLQGKGEGITITPYAAGHLLGGTIWKITVDAEDIIYAVDYNHRKERHLNGTVLETFVRPAVLITDSYNALNNQASPRKREVEFLDVIMKTLRGGGNVLLPVESAGRVLELVLYLDKCWAADKLNYPMAFLTNVSFSTLEFAKSLPEWMSDAIVKSFEHTRDNSFVLKYLKLCHTRKELDETPLGPKVVFASMASLEAGFARELFIEWATESSNLVLFTERAQIGTLSRKLQAEPPPKVVKVTMSSKIPLTGEELKAFEEQIRVQQEALKAAANIIPAEDGGPSPAVASPVPMEVITVESTTKPSEGTNKSITRSSRPPILCEGFTSPPNLPAPMFPFHERNADWDEYGEIINPDDYISKDEDMIDATTQAPVADGGKLKADGETAEALMTEKPSKVVLEDITVQVRCGLQYVDFEGRSDGRSIKKTLAHVSPLKLVLIHGSAEATEHLRQHCQKNVCQFVYAPRISESVDITSDLSAYKVRLTEQLMSSVLFRKLGDYELAWVDGEIGAKEEDMLPLVPLSSTPPPHKAVYVGDLRLPDFKQLLATKGVQAEFAGGVLRCGENITVRRSGGQQLVIEGPLSEDYYKIREVLYSQFYML